MHVHNAPLLLVVCLPLLHAKKTGIASGNWGAGVAEAESIAHITQLQAEISEDAGTATEKSQGTLGISQDANADGQVQKWHQFFSTALGDDDTLSADAGTKQELPTTADADVTPSDHATAEIASEQYTGVSKQSEPQEVSADSLTTVAGLLGDPNTQAASHPAFTDVLSLAGVAETDQESTSNITATYFSAITRLMHGETAQENTANIKATYDSAIAKLKHAEAIPSARQSRASQPQLASVAASHPEAATRVKATPRRLPLYRGPGLTARKAQTTSGNARFAFPAPSLGQIAKLARAAAHHKAAAISLIEKSDMTAETHAPSKKSVAVQSGSPKTKLSRPTGGEVQVVSSHSQAAVSEQAAKHAQVSPSKPSSATRNQAVEHESSKLSAHAEATQRLQRLMRNPGTRYELLSAVQAARASHVDETLLRAADARLKQLEKMGGFTDTNIQAHATHPQAVASHGAVEHEQVSSSRPLPPARSQAIEHEPSKLTAAEATAQLQRVLGDPETKYAQLLSAVQTAKASHVDDILLQVASAQLKDLKAAKPVQFQPLATHSQAAVGQRAAQHKQVPPSKPLPAARSQAIEHAPSKLITTAQATEQLQRVLGDPKTKYAQLLSAVQTAKALHVDDILLQVASAQLADLKAAKPVLIQLPATHSQAAVGQRAAQHKQVSLSKPLPAARSQAIVHEPSKLSAHVEATERLQRVMRNPETKYAKLPSAVQAAKASHVDETLMKAAHARLKELSGLTPGQIQASASHSEAVASQQAGENDPNLFAQLLKEVSQATNDQQKSPGATSSAVPAAAAAHAPVGQSLAMDSAQGERDPLGTALSGVKDAVAPTAQAIERELLEDPPAHAGGDWKKLLRDLKVNDRSVNDASGLLALKSSIFSKRWNRHHRHRLRKQGKMDLDPPENMSFFARTLAVNGTCEDTQYACAYPGAYNESYCCPKTCKRYADSCPEHTAVRSSRDNDVPSGRTATEQTAHCCEALCGGHQCQSGYILNPHSQHNFVDGYAGGCCEKTCAAHKCSPGWKPIAAMAKNTYPSDTSCCEPTCAIWNCTDGWYNTSDPTILRRTNRSNEACCVGDCSDYSCPSGQSLRPSVESLPATSTLACCELDICSELRNNRTSTGSDFCGDFDAGSCSMKYKLFNQSGQVITIPCKVSSVGLCQMDESQMSSTCSGFR
eukprot:TRINITY_DN612_c0_g1_i4.p1 TRINITY_DN612_c0_g1~~TRINITY_DN612_c0_g1_i4.p1  ORF type:complete len:1179 (-),score=200.26 TRINITY_DN612_c0_g1_i4:168-3704(-)